MPDTTEYNNPHKSLTRSEKYLHDSLQNIIENSDISLKYCDPDWDKLEHLSRKMIHQITNAVRIAGSLNEET